MLRVVLGVEIRVVQVRFKLCKTAVVLAKASHGEASGATGTEVASRDAALGALKAESGAQASAQTPRPALIARS